MKMLFTFLLGKLIRLSVIIVLGPNEFGYIGRGKCVGLESGTVSCIQNTKGLYKFVILEQIKRMCF